MSDLDPMELRREAMARAAAAVAQFDPSETAGDGTLCSTCGEEVTRMRSGEEPAREAPRLERYRCPRGNCDWRICYFCAYGMDCDDVLRCAACGLEAEERKDSDEESESGDDEDEEEEDGAGGGASSEPPLEHYGGRGRGLGRGRGGSSAYGAPPSQEQQGQLQHQHFDAESAGKKRAR